MPFKTNTSMLHAILVVCFLLIILPLGVQASITISSHDLMSSQQEVVNKIDSVVLEEIQAQGETDFFIWLKEQADVSGARQLQTKVEKGQYVFDTLRETAELTQRDLRAFLDTQGIEYHSFYIVNTIMVSNGDHNLLMDLAAHPDVSRIMPNRSFQLQEPFREREAPPHVAAVETNISFIRATDVWDMGITGQGTVLAGADTGMQWDHSALINHYRGWNGVTVDHNYNWWDATGTYPTVPNDGHGHGTHISGTMVGDDGGVNQIGVAPGAQVIHCKNMTDSGSGNDFTFLTCFQWTLAPWDLNGANPMPSLAPHAMNNSWGYWGGGAPQFETAIDNLHAAGILVEVSAGNEGPGCATLRSPGDYSSVLTTGSVNHAGGVLPGTLTGFSSRGPSSLYPDAFMPIIMAPGELIRSSLPGDTYASWSGTSMAGPHAAALVGLMWSANPALVGIVEETIQIIKDTAVPLNGEFGSNCGGNYNTGPNNDWGFGTIDALAAVQQAILFGGIGTLNGTVSDVESGSPIENATIQAILLPDATLYSAITDGDGHYSRRVRVGNYIVTASAYGYSPQAFAGIVVNEDMTTTVNFTLSPAGSHVVNGQVTDTNTGWPLYARIDINGYPFGPVWTDPATGEYTITLAEAVEYTFHVSAWVDGYLTANRPVGPLTGDVSEDFALAIDSIACSAPGYTPIYTFFEDFESGYTNWNMSGLWNAQSQTDTCGSQVAPFPSPVNAAYFGNAAACNFDVGVAAGSLTMVNPVNIPGAGAILTYWSYEQTECGGNCLWDKRYTEISTDGGVNWIVIGEGQTEGIWHQRNFDLAPYAGEEVHVRFRFNSIDSINNNFFGWMVDDVAVVSGCQPAAGSLVVGNVYDENTGAGLPGAIVTGSNGEMILAQPTPLDPGVDDGFYTLFAPQGNNLFTATINNYGSDSANITASNGQTVAQNFQLSTGWLQAQPDSLTVTLLQGNSTTVPLNLHNLGGLDADFQIVEFNSGFSPATASISINVPASGRLPPEGTAAALSDHFPALTSHDWSYESVGSINQLDLKVLIVYADDGNGEPLRSILAAQPDIGVVDVWLARGGDGSIPPLGVLQTYDVVVTWSNYAYADRNVMGDVLAEYVDGGGYVVQGVFNWFDIDIWGLGGRFASEGYSPFININGGNHFNFSDLGIYDVGHPLMDGVTAASDFYRDIINLQPGATLVANWADGEEFIAYKGSVVAINAYPGFYYQWTGDVGRIFSNAILFLAQGAGVPWLSETPVQATVPAMSTQIVNVTFDATVPEVDELGIYTAILRMSNNTVYGPIYVPITMQVVDVLYDVNIDPHTALGSANPGSSATYTLTVTNEGSQTDTFTLAVSGNTWQSTLSHNSVTLAAGSNTDVVVTVGVPLNAMGGDSDVATVTAVSTNDPLAAQASSQLTTHANSIYGAGLSAEVTALSALIGETVVYIVNLTNTGNVMDTFTLSAAPHNEWVVTLPANITLGAGESTTFTSQVTVDPAAADGETFVVTITVASTADPSKVAEIDLTTTAKWLRLYLPVITRS